MIWVIVIAVLVLAAVAVLLIRRGGGTQKGSGSVIGVETDGRTGPAVAEFHVAHQGAAVHFDVPLPQGDIDDVLADLLVREAVEVVREKRHSLPLGDLRRVVAFGRRGDEWVQVGSVELETPGTLPPPMVPPLLPHSQSPGFDAIDRISDLPEKAPSLADRATGETLAPLGPQLRLPAALDAGLRAQGLDPTSASAVSLAIGAMKVGGYMVSERSPGTYEATRAGQRVFVRTIGHDETEHPELPKSDIDRFVIDFVSSGADRGLLISEKFAPFEIYDRERREPRMRFVTRERFQAFIDVLALG